jgi:hypothetical protein
MCTFISFKNEYIENFSSRYKKNHHNNKSMIDENDINDENKPVEDVSQMVRRFYLN